MPKRIKDNIEGYYSIPSLGADTPVLTIQDVVTEELNKKDKSVVKFAETKMKLVVNNNNMKTLFEIFGDVELEALIGEKIQLYVDLINTRGREHESVCLRKPD